MEVCIASPFGMDKWPWLLVHGGIVRFHTEVEAQEEVCEVHAQTATVCGCYLLIELVELELAAGLAFVVVNGPDVACVHEQSALKHPE